MATLKDCIGAALDAGRIDRAEARAIEDLFHQIQDQLEAAGQTSPHLIGAMAQQQALKTRQGQLALARKQKALQLLAIHKNLENIKGHPRGVATGLMSLLVKDLRGEAPYANVEARTKAILGELHAGMAEALDALRTKTAGLTQDKEMARNMVRELFGTNTGNAAAKAHAKAWSEVAEKARGMFNRAGGAIAKRKDWGLPQFHDPVAVGRAGKDAWLQFVVPRLDRSRLLNDSGLPMKDAELRTMLDEVFESISTDGLAHRIPGQQHGAKLANRRQEARILHFKSGDTWLEYHDQFGHQDVFTTMTDHLSSMAHDIALLEVLGPNPNATYRYLRDIAQQDSAKRGKMFKGVELANLDAVYNTVSGHRSVESDTRLGQIFAAVRNYMVATKLGSAMLSALSDMHFIAHTSNWNGIPATKVATRALSLMNPANSADRLMAVRMGLTADAWITKALAGNRIAEVSGTGWTVKAADFTVRASGLSAWTQATRHAFGMEFYGALADQSGKGLSELPKGLQHALEGYGIDAKAWDTLRSTDAFEYQGARFFSPENLMHRTDLPERERRELARKVQQMVLTETDYAVPTPDARIRAIISMGQQRGTIVGELARTSFQFMSFPLTVMANHLSRGFSAGGGLSVLGYLSTLLIGTTAFGSLSLQSRQVSQGKELRPMDDPKFWLAALAQGGGLGIWGDFLFSDVNRFGGSPIVTLGGPTAQFMGDVRGATQGNIQRLIKGEDTQIGKDLINLVGSYTPAASSLWYTRLLFERAVVNQLQMMADPDALRDFARQEDRQQRDYRQGFYWRPGESLPEGFRQ